MVSTMTIVHSPLLQGSVPALDGASVLITGGTGSFGRAFVDWLVAHDQVQKIVVFSRDEQKHYREQQRRQDPRLRYFVGDVRDKNRLMKALNGIDIVVHAAAMKHVPIAEYNPMEAIRTNIEGAANLVDAAIERGVKRVVALSTDKAVSPVNLYGATKLCMEKLLVAANSYVGDRPTRFDLVRYGNVVGSEGSVVPLFLRQRQTGKLTLTDPNMTRFWIGMPDAVGLVLLALREGTGGDVFIPKLPACTIETLAEAIAPGLEREIVGIRSGEKMHETLITSEESRRVVEYERHYLIRPEFPWWGHRPAAPEGKPVAGGFEYSSNTTEMLSVEQTRALLRKLNPDV